MKRWPELIAAAALVAALATAVLAQERSTPAQPQAAAKPATAQAGHGFGIRDVRVFDGGRVIERANVGGRGGRIAAVGADARPPDGLGVVDEAGETPLPGLLDAHVHRWGNARADALRLGVTTELDM